MRVFLIVVMAHMALHLGIICPRFGLAIHMALYMVAGRVTTMTATGLFAGNQTLDGLITDRTL
jgi:hypothetical protein